MSENSNNSSTERKSSRSIKDRIAELQLKSNNHNNNNNNIVGFIHSKPKKLSQSKLKNIPMNIPLPGQQPPRRKVSTRKQQKESSTYSDTELLHHVVDRAIITNSSKRRQRKTNRSLDTIVFSTEA